MTVYHDCGEEAEPFIVNGKQQTCDPLNVRKRGQYAQPMFYCAACDVVFTKRLPSTAPAEPDRMTRAYGGEHE